LAEFHLQLILEYFQARSTGERTAATLAAIVEHVCTTYALGATEAQALQAAAKEEAQRKGWRGGD
jgi:hypothetical protein